VFLYSDTWPANDVHGLFYKCTLQVAARFGLRASRKCSSRRRKAMVCRLQVHYEV